MSIEYKKTRKEALFNLSGYIGMEECEGLLEAARKCTGRQITIDMQGCDGIHTSVLQVIISLASTAKKQGISLRLIKPPGFLPGILARGGFEGWLRIN